MTVKSVIKLACLFLGLDEISECNVFNTSGESPTKVEQKEIDTLVRCLNIVLQEIATSFIDVVGEKDVDFKNGKYPLNEIDDKFLEVLYVSVNGKKIKFKEKMDFLFADADSAKVVYRKYPQIVDIDDTCPNFNFKLAEKTLAYGVALEYSFVNSLSDEASIFENRYKNDLLIATRKNGEKRLKCRRWL